MKYKAVIFDLDGVICHTDMYHYQAWKQIADELGIYFDEEINNRLRGVSRMESFEIILERYEGTMSLEDKVVYTTRKNEAYKELLKNMSPADLSPEVKETLDGLRAKGLKLGNRLIPARMQALSWNGLDWTVILMQYLMEITLQDPSRIPEVFVKAAQLVGEASGDCLVVEDAKAGLEAAIGGGMDCAAMGDAVASGLATYDLTEFSDLLKITE